MRSPVEFVGCVLHARIDCGLAAQDLRPERTFRAACPQPEVLRPRDRALVTCIPQLRTVARSLLARLA